MPKSEKSGNWFKRHKILTGILALIILFVIVGAAGSGKQNKPTTQTTTATKPAATVANVVSQSAAENYCQDAGLLQNYIDIKTTDIVTLSYNPHYIDSGMKASNGDAIWDLQWSGKNKSTGASVGFVCMVSGTDKKVTLNELAIDGKAVYGPVDEK